MNYPDIVNCYCFNASCKNSIFNTSKNAAVAEPLSRVLSETLYCKSCNGELVSKPTLEIKSEIKSSMERRDRYRAIVIDDDPYFHLMINNSLKETTAFQTTWNSTNGCDVLIYLRENSGQSQSLPDFIFVDVNMKYMDGWEFLEECSKIYDTLEKKPQVFMTSNYLLPEHKAKTKEYRFVKGIIPKPLQKGLLKEIAEVFEPAA